MPVITCTTTIHIPTHLHQRCEIRTLVISVFIDKDTEAQRVQLIWKAHWLMSSGKRMGS